MGVTPEQETHLECLKLQFGLWADKKYRNGQREHGGNLWENTPIRLVELAIDEAVDQVAYLLTLRDKLVANTLPDAMYSIPAEPVSDFEPDEVD